MFYFSTVLFLLIILMVVFGGHYFVYVSLIKFLNVSNRFGLALGLAFLSVSFLLANGLLREENFLSKTYFFISGLWLGVLANLIIALVLTWVLTELNNVLGASINVVFWGRMLIIISLFVSGWGVWNAKNPVVKSINVKIANLSQEWQGKKIIQLTDLHLGVLNNKNFLLNIKNKINEIEPEMVVITGDLFNEINKNSEEYLKIIDEIKSKQGIYMVIGNHESYVGLDKALELLKKTKVKVLRDEVVDIQGLKLIGVDYLHRNEEDRVIGVLEKLKDKYQNQPNILLYHAPAKIEEISKSGVNLELCGHTHRGQIFPLNFITSLVYKGYDNGLFEMGNYSLYTSVGTGFWGVSMRTGNRPEITVINLE